MENSTDVQLRKKILSTLEMQGFVVSDRKIELPEPCSKDTLRKISSFAVEYARERSKGGLKKHEDQLIRFIANGNEITPDSIKPRLLTVEPKSENERLFRYIRLHWSVPVSAGYGRRLRFLVMDESNDKLIGIIGLCDPVYALKARDEWIGWNEEQKKNRLYHVMDAFVLGAVPPYNQLLCGKLIAMLIMAREIRQVFRERYADTESLISGKKREPLLALVTTASAFGRSSIYNRLKIGDHRFMQSVGYTKGSGDFQFYNGAYKDLTLFVKKHCEPSLKHQEWGSGFRNKREIIKKGLKAIGLPGRLAYHNINREIFLSPLAKNAPEFLRGETNVLDDYDVSVDDIYDMFRKRWLIQRATTHSDYKTFSNSEYRLW